MQTCTCIWIWLTYTCTCTVHVVPDVVWLWYSQVIVFVLFSLQSVPSAPDKLLLSPLIVSSIQQLPLPNLKSKKLSNHNVRPLIYY